MNRKRFYEYLFESHVFSNNCDQKKEMEMNILHCKLVFIRHTFQLNILKVGNFRQSIAKICYLSLVEYTLPVPVALVAARGGRGAQAPGVPLVASRGQVQKPGVTLTQVGTLRQGNSVRYVFFIIQI